jgi:autotransporter-associated beta strand protein
MQRYANSKRAVAIQSALSNWQTCLTAGVVFGAAASQCKASVVYNALNETIDSAGTTSATVSFPAVGSSTYDNQPAFVFNASATNGINVTKVSSTLPGSIYGDSYSVNVATVNQTAVGQLTAFSSLGLISSASPTALPGTYNGPGQVLVTADGTGGNFTEAAGLKYLGIQYGSGSTAHYGWIGFQTLGTTSDPAGDVKGLITGIALESTGGLAIQAGSLTSYNSSSGNLYFSGAAGNGAWDLTTANFNNGTGTVAYQDLNSVTLDDAHNTGGQYNLTLSANGTTAVSGSLSPSSFSVTTSNTYTLNGVGISGSTTLTKSGTGGLVLNNSDTYRGETDINQGSLALTPVGAILNSTTVRVGISGGTSATLTFQAATSGGILLRDLVSTLNVLNGSATLAATTNSANRQLLSVGQMSISVTGKLDLNNNDLDFRTAAGSAGLTIAQNNLPVLFKDIQNGYNNGNWNGSWGIVSTSAGNDTTHLTALGMMVNNADGSTPIYSTFDGQTVYPYDIFVKYTYYGDANLDGKVDGSDYSLIDNAYLNNQDSDDNGTLTGWFNGDFNYDGVINGSDYTLIDNAFNRQGASLTAVLASSTAQIAPAATSAVPEPTSLGLLAMGASGLLAYRRRRLPS